MNKADELYPNPQLCNTYIKYYQSGGSFPVFQGSRYQHGEGFGSILKGSVGFYSLL